MFVSISWRVRFLPVFAVLAAVLLIVVPPVFAQSSALTGTVTDDAEADIVSGGSTIILTLTDITWVATVGDDNGITDALISGIDSAQSEGSGWDAVVKAGLAFGNVTRTSATVVTITLPAFGSYDITAPETITVTIPATALTSNGAVVASPTFNVTSTSGTAALAGTITNDAETDIVSGGSTIILTLTSDTWVATVGDDNGITMALINGIDSAQSEGSGWDAVVKAGLAFGDITRTSATVVTITLPAFGSYDITATETITVTVPATALVTSGSPIVASPTFSVTATPAPEEEAPIPTTPIIDATQSAEEIIDQLADLAPEDIANALEIIDDTTKLADVVTQLPVEQIGEVFKALNVEKAAEVIEKLPPAETKLIIENLAADQEGTTKAAEILETLVKTDPKMASNAISEVEAEIAATVIDEVEKAAAGAILTELPVEKRLDVVLNMDPDSLKDRLAEVAPTALTEMDASKLMAKLPDISAEQLSSNKTPEVEEGTPAGKVVQTFGNVAIYEVAGQVGKFIWVKLVGSPDPIDQVIAQFTEDVSNVSIIVNSVGPKKPSVAPVLPDGLVASSYFYVTPSVEPEQIKSAVISFFVEKSWLAENGFHKWSIVLQRLDSEAGVWQAVPTQRTSEDETRVHYDAPVPGFSLFAITGGTEPAALAFSVANLQLSPAIAVEGAPVTITSAVTNTGTTDETFPINLSINDVVDDSVSIAVAAGATETVTFTTLQAVGAYEVRVDRLFGNFTVVAQAVTPTPTPVTPQPTATPAPTATAAPAPEDDDDGNLALIIGIIIVVVVLGGGILFFVRRSRGSSI